MTRVVAPTWVETRALHRGAGGLTVRRTGVGPRAAARWSAAHPDGPLVVAGVAGGLADLVPGTVVVADEVRGAGRPTPCPGAPLLAAALREAGLDVRVGAVVSTKQPVSGSARHALAATGALAVDMESAWLVRGRTDAVVVRVVADPAGATLWQPATLFRLARAVRVLARIAPVLRTWQRAGTPRRVLLPGPRSFCAGVVRAVRTVEDALQRTDGPVHVRREIVHNRHVVAGLRERGAVFVDELEQVPTGATVVLSAHGVAPVVHAEAAARQLTVLDATCPLVSKVHAEVRRFADAGETVLFIGHAGHEESVGTMGERPAATVLVEDAVAARSVVVPDPQRVAYLVQTTLATDEVAETVAVLRERFPALRGPASSDICYATTNRQRALQEVVAEAELCLVVGSTNSSNARRLVELAGRQGTDALLVDDASAVGLERLVGVTSLAVTSGASTPDSVVDSLLAALRALGPVTIEHRDLTVETVAFSLPKEHIPT